MKLTPADRKDIVAALQSGKSTTAELSSQYGITRGHVRVVYKKETGTKLKPGKRLTQSEKDAIVGALLANTMPVGELAALYGITPSALSYVYKKKTGTSHRSFPGLKLSSQEKETIVAALLAKKATIAELAKQFAVPRSSISKLFKKQTGKSFGATDVPDSVKQSIIEEIRTKPRQDLGDKGVQYPLQKDPLDRALCEREKPCFIAMNTAHRRYQGLGEV